MGVPQYTSLKETSRVSWLMTAMGWKNQEVTGKVRGKGFSPMGRTRDFGKFLGDQNQLFPGAAAEGRLLVPDRQAQARLQEKGAHAVVGAEGEIPPGTQPEGLRQSLQGVPGFHGTGMELGRLLATHAPAGHRQ